VGVEVGVGVCVGVDVGVGVQATKLAVSVTSAAPGVKVVAALPRSPKTPVGALHAEKE
jgi:hypothetical protein